MMTLKALLLSTAVLFATPAFAQNAAPTAPAPAATAAATTVSDPAEFATKAAIGNMFELQSSALAQDNTQNADVLAFAQHMTTDHSKAAQDMMTAATTEKVTHRPSWTKPIRRSSTPLKTPTARRSMPHTGGAYLGGARPHARAAKGLHLGQFLAQWRRVERFARLGGDPNEVFSAYAPSDDMIIYGRGVRRRLAPLLNGDQRRVALAFSLMLSLPGTPLIYYGR